MSDYVKRYNVFEEAGLTQNTELTTACEAIAQWINDELSDILTAKYTLLVEKTYQARVDVYEKNSSNIGFYFGNASSATYNVTAGLMYNKNNTSSIVMTYDNGIGTAENGYLSFGKANNSLNKLQLLDYNPMLMQLAVIRGENGWAADFVAPQINANKKVMYAFCDGVTLANVSNALYAEKDGAYYSMGALPLQSGLTEKVLSKIALPGTSILPEHLYLSDNFVGSNNPYNLNGKDYVDVLFCNTDYRGFAMEL